MAVFREVARVLKPGGVFLFKTPNKTHSMPTIARLTPHRFHQFVNRIRGRAEADPFPTRYPPTPTSPYNASPPPAASPSNASTASEGRSDVLRLTWPTDRLGAAYERLVNSWDGLALFRILLVGELRKGRKDANCTFQDTAPERAK